MCVCVCVCVAQTFYRQRRRGDKCAFVAVAEAGVQSGTGPLGWDYRALAPLGPVRPPEKITNCLISGQLCLLARLELLGVVFYLVHHGLLILGTVCLQLQ